MNHSVTSRTASVLVYVAICLLGSAQAADSTTAASVSFPKPTPKPDEDIKKLSPFVVTSSANDIGYYAENTLAGSRLNTNIGDLAASITVVTRQQMLDTASINLNDVFLYESNTECTGNYTAFAFDNRGGISDNTAVSPTTSNRVRGIGSVDSARDYYPSITQFPFDVYNTESVGINRGPNSLLFGLGSPSGIVNQSAVRSWNISTTMRPRCCEPSPSTRSLPGGSCCSVCWAGQSPACRLHWSSTRASARRWPCSPDQKKLSLGEAVNRIAQLGGYLQRKCDGPPGFECLWRGYIYFEAMVYTIRLQRAAASGSS